MSDGASPLCKATLLISALRKNAGHHLHGVSCCQKAVKGVSETVVPGQVDGFVGQHYGIISSVKIMATSQGMGWARGRVRVV